MAVRAETQIDLARVDDGTPGVNPTATVTKTGDTATITITDANQTTTASVSDGTNGADGVSITSVTPQYYLSTSSSSATGGSWSDTPQAFVSGYYYWTRDYITYSNNTTGTSTAVYNAGMTQAAQDAYDANTTATNTAKYFWFKTTGNEAGAHITEVDQTTFESTPTGGNILITSLGMMVRKGLQVFAQFLSNGLTVQTYDSNNNVVEIAHLGYGTTNTSGGGTAERPYYTLGTRKSGTTAGTYSLAEGEDTEASGAYSHAEGRQTKATRPFSHAEGWGCVASYQSAHAEGDDTTASGMESHAEGDNTKASGIASHAEGSWTTASGDYSHAQNQGTKAASTNQTALGKYNVTDSNGTYAVIVGNGTQYTPSNALTIDWNGKVQTPQIQMGTIASDTVAANSYLDKAVTFTPSMSGTPTVVCCLNSTSTAGAIGSLSVAVYSASSTGFTARIFNAGSTGRTPAVNWIAING